MDIAYYLLLLALLLIGWFVNIAGLPGLWLMVGAYGLYALVTGWGVFVGWQSMTILLLLALAAEAAEFFAGAAGSAAAGGRKRGMVGAIVGGFLGAIFLSVIPIPIVAQVVGACLGAFIGAAVMEFTDKDIAHSFRVGVGAAKGRLWGIVSKLAFGLAMFFVAALAALPYGRSSTMLMTPPLVAPASSPATLPSTGPANAPTT
ncbi:MAG: DUF456 domain-containing protein [Tepidisphaeraceae bacterium]